jgi:demethylmenaquinone methyltransferase / 2-methoxy-6-polyprenyl-1,4-benzoquinol methylase
MFTRTFHAVMGRSVLPIVGGLATGNLAAYTYLPRSISTFDTVARYGDRLRAAGFADVQVQPLTHGVAAVVRATRVGAEAHT